MRWRLGFLAVFLFCLASIAFALYHQIYDWIMPCLQCVYERMVFIVIGFFSLLAVFWLPRGRGGVAVLSGSVLASALVGGGVAAKHLSLQYGHPDPAVSCAATLPFPINLNDPFWPKWLGMLIRPVGDCSQIDFVVLGLSMPVWVLLSCLAIAVLALCMGIMRWKQLSRRRLK